MLGDWSCSYTCMNFHIKMFFCSYLHWHIKYEYCNHWCGVPLHIILHVCALQLWSQYSSGTKGQKEHDGSVGSVGSVGRAVPSSFIAIAFSFLLIVVLLILAFDWSYRTGNNGIWVALTGMWYTPWNLYKLFTTTTTTGKLLMTDDSLLYLCIYSYHIAIHVQCAVKSGRSSPPGVFVHSKNRNFGFKF